MSSFRRPLRRVHRSLMLLGFMFSWSGFVFAQMSPEEHASHHPGQNASPGATAGMSSMGASPAPAAKGGMMEGMGEMMKEMGAPKAKELYPELMSLPELTPEKRDEVERQAHERMQTGATLMSEALSALQSATAANDLKEMEVAIAHLHEGMARYESGVAAHRAIAEGKAPRAIALQWFKRETNLSLGTAPAAHRGITPFHLFTMVLLVGFALAMLTLYYFKMRRAAALFGRIEADKGPPPPGSAPELADPNVRPEEALLNCAVCHQTKDRHLGLFGNDCASCHTTAKWTIAEYRHPSSASQSCAQCHQAPPSHYMEHFKMISMKIARMEKAEVNQCFLCHQTTAWNDIKGVGFYKHH